MYAFYFKKKQVLGAKGAQQAWKCLFPPFKAMPGRPADRHDDL